MTVIGREGDGVRCAGCARCVHSRTKIIIIIMPQLPYAACAAAVHLIGTEPLLVGIATDHLERRCLLHRLLLVLGLIFLGVGGCVLLERVLAGHPGVVLLLVLVVLRVGPEDGGLVKSSL